MHNKPGNVFSSDGNSSFEIAGLSIIGDRTEQQDDFAMILDYDTVFAVVCDGMGGHKGGKDASNIAIDALSKSYKMNRKKLSDAKFLIDAAIEADLRISSLVDKKGNLIKAGSTVVSVCVVDRKLSWCAVGDSRLYLFRQGALAQITQDQNYKTVLDEKLNAHLISHEEYNKELSKGEMLINYLGIGNISFFDHNSSPLSLIKDDKLILMSDGLYKILCDDEIRCIMNNFNSVGDAAKALEIKARNVAIQKSIDRDNLTVVIIKIK